MPQLKRTVALPGHLCRLKFPTLLPDLFHPSAQNRHLIRLPEACQEQYLANESQSSCHHQHPSPSQSLRNSSANCRPNGASNQRRKHDQTHRTPALLALKDVANDSWVEHIGSNGNASKHARCDKQVGGLRCGSDEGEDDEETVAGVHDGVASDKFGKRRIEEWSGCFTELPDGDD